MLKDGHDVSNIKVKQTNYLFIFFQCDLEKLFSFKIIETKRMGTLK